MSGTTVLSSQVAADRVITKFQPAFHGESTPYQKVNFHPKVKAACSENRTGRVGLKITKAVIVGDVCTGKTCLVNRFCHDIFQRDYKTTIGVDFEVEKFSVLSNRFTLQIWDTAGQERFKCIAASYYRGAQIVIVTFDLTEQESLHHCADWMNAATEHCDQPIRILLGTKKDLLSPASYAEIETKALKFAKSLGAEYWATSSKSGENVQEFFFRAVCLAFDAAILRELETVPNGSKSIGSDLINIGDSPDLYDKKNKKVKCCAK